MTNITPEQIAAWRELAEKATPRPWVKDSKFVSYPVKDSFGRQLWMPANEHYSDGDPDTDAEFIVAAVNNFIPALDEIERLTAESQEWKNLSNTFKFFANLADTNSDQLAKDNDRLASENAALKARAEAAERDNAETKSTCKQIDELNQGQKLVIGALEVAKNAWKKIAEDSQKELEQLKARRCETCGWFSRFTEINKDSGVCENFHIVRNENDYSSGWKPKEADDAN